MLDKLKINEGEKKKPEREPLSSFVGIKAALPPLVAEAGMTVVSPYVDMRGEFSKLLLRKRLPAVPAADWFPQVMRHLHLRTSVCRR